MRKVITMSTRTTDAVSPVVGVMLMLVVVIIIAAVVSAFSGELVNSESKTPQATIKATFSISDGMTISHAGGEAIPLNNLIFITQNGDGFGPNTHAVTTQRLDLSLITDKDGNQVFLTGQIGEKTSFNPGDTLYISAYNSSCSILQYSVSAPLFDVEGVGGDDSCLQDGDTPWHWEDHPTVYPDPGHDWYEGCPELWQLCFRNPDNIGKVFILKAIDKSGNLISKSEVKITS